MRQRRVHVGSRWKAGLRLVVAGLLMLPVPAGAQGDWFFFRHRKQEKPEAATPRSQVISSQPPAAAIAVEPLGFSAPGPIYEGQRDALVSLDFLDEDTLLFTFRVPGLMRRDNKGGEQRQIRALVMALPHGTVQAEALWTLHDDARYVWRLKDGRFLLRDLNQLRIGDASLELTPFLEFPGHVQWLGMDPDQTYLVTDSHEPEEAKQPAGHAASTATTAGNVTAENAGEPGRPDTVLRVLRRSTGKVMLVSHVRSVMRVPVNGEGYMESLRSTGRDWLLNLNYFGGGERVAGKIESLCTPNVEFFCEQAVLATVCTENGGLGEVAMTTDGRKLWENDMPLTHVWPKLVIAPGGQRIARETLLVNRPINAFSPLSFEDVTGQQVEVFDSATGKLVLKVSASPVFDGGGNVALSPSGRRVAILDAGAIQVYELPKPPPAPTETAEGSAAH